MGDAEQAQQSAQGGFQHSKMAMFAGILLLVPIFASVLKFLLNRELSSIFTTLGVFIGILFVAFFMGVSWKLRISLGVVLGVLSAVLMMFEEFFITNPQLLIAWLPVVIFAFVVVFKAPKMYKIIFGIISVFSVILGYIPNLIYLNNMQVFVGSLVINVVLFLFIAVMMWLVHGEIKELGGRESLSNAEQLRLGNLRVGGVWTLRFLLLLPIMNFILAWDQQYLDVAKTFIGALGQRNLWLIGSLYLLVGVLLWWDHSKKKFGVFGTNQSGAISWGFSRTIEIILIFLGLISLFRIVFAPFMNPEPRLDAIGVIFLFFVVVYCFIVVLFRKGWVSKILVLIAGVIITPGLQVGLSKVPYAAPLANWLEGVQTAYPTMYWIAIGVFIAIYFAGDFTDLRGLE